MRPIPWLLAALAIGFPVGISLWVAFIRWAIAL